MNHVIQKLSDYGIVPVIKLENAENAVPLCNALIMGGLPVAEVTYRTDAAEESIRRIHGELPEMVLGAGTVLTTKHVESAKAAGASYIVSPGTNEDVIRCCKDNDLPILPGIITPSEIERVIALGITTVKLFPAQQLGGIGYIKALSAPYTGITFVPTGGIHADNINEYLAFPKVLACGGSWMVQEDLVKAGRFDQIANITKQAVATVLGFELAHVGINPSNAEALEIAKLFGNLFGKEVIEGNSSVFCGDMFECMRQNNIGEKGHIAIRTNCIARAIQSLKRKGFSLDESSAKTGADGKTKSIYLKNEVAGFAIHLLQKEV